MRVIFFFCCQKLQLSFCVLLATITFSSAAHASSRQRRQLGGFLCGLLGGVGFGKSTITR